MNVDDSIKCESHKLKYPLFSKVKNNENENEKSNLIEAYKF